MILGTYRGAATVCGPLISLLLKQRLRRGKEDPARSDERRGITSHARPEGHLVWIHAASVGEAISVLCLVERLVADYPNSALLVTTGTVTSAAIMATRLPDGVIHQYIPVDRPAWVKRFLNHWKPDLVLWMESEFWPNLLCDIHRRGIPLILLNGRVSPSSYKGWSRFPKTIKRLLNCFTLCMAQSDDDATKLRDLGAPAVTMPGNLKFASAPLPVDGAQFSSLRTMIGDRPVWLAASTHAGEEEIVLAAHKELKSTHPNLLTIIAPRHPARSPAIGALLEQSGTSVATRSKNDPIMPETGFYIADTVGEMGLLYRIVPLALIGGSLIPHGGQNVLEAAKLNCAILHGPHMTNFRTIADEMKAAGAAITINNAAELAGSVSTLLSDDDARTRQTGAASEIAEAKEGVLDNVVEALQSWLTDKKGGGNARA